MIITLPLPPSVNAMFVKSHGKSKYGKSLSHEYKAWRDHAGLIIKRPKSPMPKPYRVLIRLNVDHKSDIDNRVKPILDALVRYGVIIGDQWVNQLTVCRDRSVSGCLVTVESLQDDENVI